MLHSALARREMEHEKVTDHRHNESDPVCAISFGILFLATEDAFSRSGWQRERYGNDGQRCTGLQGNGTFSRSEWERKDAEPRRQCTASSGTTDLQRWC